MTKLVVGGSKKPTTETLAERLAFNDPDRTTPLHDDICLWLDGWLRSEAGPRALTGYRAGLRWTPEAVKRELDQAQERIESGRRGCALYSAKEHLEPWQERALDLARRWSDWSVPVVPAVSDPIVTSIVWEFAVGNERWVSGFIDLLANINVPRAPILFAEHFTESPPARWEERSTSLTYAFEVKSVIPSLGELIRQVRYYESKMPGRYYVVAPDATQAEMLRSQRIGFVHYPTGEVTTP